MATYKRRSKASQKRVNAVLGFLVFVLALLVVFSILSGLPSALHP